MRWALQRLSAVAHRTAATGTGKAEQNMAEAERGLAAEREAQEWRCKVKQRRCGG